MNPLEFPSRAAVIKSSSTELRHALGFPPEDGTKSMPASCELNGCTFSWLKSPPKALDLPQTSLFVAFPGYFKAPTHRLRHFKAILNLSKDFSSLPRPRSRTSPPPPALTPPAASVRPGPATRAPARLPRLWGLLWPRAERLTQGRLASFTWRAQRGAK